MEYRTLKPKEIIRKTDQAGYTVNGEKVWRTVTGFGFKAGDCMSGHIYRRKITPKI